MKKKLDLSVIFRSKVTWAVVAETLILLVNAGDRPARAVLYPALFREGPDAAKPIDLSGTYRSADGMTVTARDSLSCKVPPESALILKKA